ncbi:hypothetical protein [Aliikangiella maris]|uniref:DUF7931 domain-containing protein n=2 Tax=Aliikangiella maris TaxID=3162458 RepID=A0ABV2BPB9_9GAMM
MNDEQTETIHTTSGLGELKPKVLDYFLLARQKIQLYTDNLDPRILNDSQIESALRQFIRLSRNSRLEILIKDERNLQGIDHAIVRLSQKYTSFIDLRVIPKDFHDNYFSFYIIDGKRMIYRPQADRYEAEYRQLPDGKLNQRSKYFNEVWQQSAQAIYLRALCL